MDQITLHIQLWTAYSLLRIRKFLVFIVVVFLSILMVVLCKYLENSSFPS